MSRLSAFASCVAIAILCGPSAVRAADAAPSRVATSMPTTAGGGSAQLILSKGDRVVIIGDSITEQKLYSRYIEDYLIACQPQLNLWVYQLGWGGEWAGGFLQRMDSDLLPLKANVITTCYGMNDGGSKPWDESTGQKYQADMKALVERAKAAGMKVVVGSPGAVDTDFFRGPNATPAQYNDVMDHLKAIDRQLAAEEGVVFANVHDPLMSAMSAAKSAMGKEYHVCGGDGVHPQANGHVVMAYAFLKAMGFDGDLGTIRVDLAGVTTATGGHKVLSSRGGRVEIESTRYPFCFQGDGNEKSPKSMRSILPYVPFNDDLNRLTLVVSGLESDRAKVTWGAQTRSFSREQLAKGINLAGEFLDNPLADAFKKVDEAVAAKQNLETYYIKVVLHELPSKVADQKGDAELEAAFETIQDRLKTRHEKLSQAVRDAVVPVTHTIVIEAE